MPHRRSPSKAVGDGRALLVEGLVCRESNVADRLVNKRWMQVRAALPGVLLCPPLGGAGMCFRASAAHPGTAAPAPGQSLPFFPCWHAAAALKAC